jgi:hypothetical protein
MKGLSYIEIPASLQRHLDLGGAGRHLGALVRIVAHAAELIEDTIPLQIARKLVADRSASAADAVLSALEAAGQIAVVGERVALVDPRRFFPAAKDVSARREKDRQRKTGEHSERNPAGVGSDSEETRLASISPSGASGVSNRPSGGERDATCTECRRTFTLPSGLDATRPARCPRCYAARRTHDRAEQEAAVALDEPTCPDVDAARSGLGEPIGMGEVASRTRRFLATLRAGPADESPGDPAKSEAEAATLPPDEEDARWT